MVIGIFLGAPNLHMVETVDSIKLADAINKSWEKKENGSKLSVFAQVNSSGEESMIFLFATSNWFVCKVFENFNLC